MLAVLLAPHQNCRYQASIEQLSRVELQLTLNAVGLDAQVCERVYAGHTALCVDAPCDDERLNRLLSGLSSAYMVCRAQPDGALYPLYGRKAALLGEDLSGILKYKGKTAETFTHLLLNVDGRVLYMDGEFKTLDEGRVRAEFAHAVDELLG